MANLNIRTDDQIKQDAEKLFEQMGMTMTTAINIFLRQALREQALPFNVTMNTPNSVTKKAFEEGNRIAYDRDVMGYKDIESLRAALEV